MSDALRIREFFDLRMNDGSRHFADLPETVFFDEMADHLEKLDGGEITNFITDGVLEMWLEFDFYGHHFSINNQFGDYWFFVDDPNCPDEILTRVCDHFRSLLEK
jgi:hypothetical protein